MTPGSARASSALIPVIRAWATGERTRARCSMPGNVMLSVQRVRPVMRRASSLRVRDFPNSGVGVVGSAVVVMSVSGHGNAGLGGNAGLHRLGGALHGAHDVLVSGAAAEVALDALADLVLVRVGVVAEQVDRLHDHPRRAEAALQGVTLVEGLLDGVQLPVAGEALDGGDLAPVGLDGEHRARLHALPVQVDRAGAAVARVAPDDRSGLPEPLPQVVDEEHAGFYLVDVLHTVDGDPDLCHEPFLLAADRDGAARDAVGRALA